MKADLRKAETTALRARVGQRLDRARAACGWNLEQLAEKLERDSRQVSRWISGEERLQLDVIEGVPDLHREFLIASFRDDAQVEVVTEIRVRRIA